MIDHSTPTLRTERLECIRNDMQLFSGLDFQLAVGQLLQVVGPNGSGKTSLLRIICGLALPHDGTVYWNDKDIQQFNGEFLREISYVGYQNGIKDELSPLENLNIAQVLKVARDEISPTQVLKQFGLQGYEDIPVRKLSSGQRRRVALSRLLLIKARLWVLDEPFTALDDDGKQIIKNMIETHVNKGGMLILASHEPIEFSNCKTNKIELGQ